jgi:hypothetical protein
MELPCAVSTCLAVNSEFDGHRSLFVQTVNGRHFVFYVFHPYLRSRTIIARRLQRPVIISFLSAAENPVVANLEMQEYIGVRRGRTVDVRDEGVSWTVGMKSLGCAVSEGVRRRDGIFGHGRSETTCRDGERTGTSLEVMKVAEPYAVSLASLSAALSCADPPEALVHRRGTRPRNTDNPWTAPQSVLVDPVCDDSFPANAIPNTVVERSQRYNHHISSSPSAISAIRLHRPSFVNEFVIDGGGMQALL